MRRKFTKVMCTVFSVLLLSNTIFAAEYTDNSIEENETIIDSIYTNNSIDALYEMRGSYCLDIENNYEIIEAIDNRLEQLGVETISYSELNKKLNSLDSNSSIIDNNKSNMIGARVALNPSSTVKWTSTRQTTVYRGKTYELQIIRGVPANFNSELSSEDSVSVIGGAGKTAATRNVVGICVDKIAGALPVVGGGLSTVKTVYDIYKGIATGMSPTSSISSIKANYTVNTVAEYIYVFVKYSGCPDAGNQILGYNGNYIDYTCGVDIPKCVYDGTRFCSDVIQKKYKGTMQAPYYNSYVDKASNNFYTYKSGNSNITQRYVIPYYYVQGVKDNIGIKVPTPNSGY